MGAADSVRMYHRAIEQGDWKKLDSLLADDFTFGGPTVVNLDKRALVSSMKALWAGFPDVRFNLRILEEGDTTVKAVSTITGTHTGNLIPPFPDKFITIAPTGKTIALSDEISTYTLRGGRLIEQRVTPKRDGGWPGILRQIGQEYPYPLPEE